MGYIPFGSLATFALSVIVPSDSVSESKAEASSSLTLLGVIAPYTGCSLPSKSSSGNWCIDFGGNVKGRRACELRRLEQLRYCQQDESYAQHTKRTAPPPLEYVPGIDGNDCAPWLWLSVFQRKRLGRCAVFTSVDRKAARASPPPRRLALTGTLIALVPFIRLHSRTILTHLCDSSPNPISGECSEMSTPITLSALVMRISILPVIKAQI